MEELIKQTLSHSPPSQKNISSQIPGSTPSFTQNKFLVIYLKSYLYEEMFVTLVRNFKYSHKQKNCPDFRNENFLHFTNQ